MIDSYKFGQIIINGEVFNKDVIVFPDHVRSNWWRREGHLLNLEDILESLEALHPQILVIGTGKFGIMKIGSKVKSYLMENHIKLHAEPTDKAIKIYNRIILLNHQILGAFHLTC